MTGSIARDEIENFLYEEAALLDGWKLEEWKALFTPDGEYMIVTPSVANPETADPATTLFLVADDQERLTQRVERLLDGNAHVEYPRSKTRHCLSNIRFKAGSGDDVVVYANFVTYRTKFDETTYFPGHIVWRLKREGGAFRIREKRCIIDTDTLAMQGKVAIIL